jgi:hypothetical protein
MTPGSTELRPENGSHWSEVRRYRLATFLTSRDSGIVQNCSTCRAQGRAETNYFREHFQSQGSVTRHADSSAGRRDQHLLVLKQASSVFSDSIAPFLDHTEAVSSLSYLS